MSLSNCNFITPRLVVKEWHSLAADDWTPLELSEVVVSMLTEPVTRSLPPSWRGEYTNERARDWIKERDAEGIVLLVVSKETLQAVGLLILFKSERGQNQETEIRLGYLISESEWGTGLATEILGGFLGWCAANSLRGTILAGVDRENHASRRVLEKNGLRPDPPTATRRSGELIYRLRIQ